VSVSEIARRFGISRTTVRAALAVGSATEVRAGAAADAG
jgi:DNA-binding FadR family transcriptional regulator